MTPSRSTLPEAATDRDQRLRQLVDACCDESATPAGVRELEDRLRSEPDAVSRYVEHVGLHTSLDWHVTSRQGMVLASDTRADAGPQEEAVVEPAASVAGRARPNGWSGVASVLLALSAGLLLAIWIGGGPWAGMADQPVAALIERHSDDACWVVLRSSELPEGMRSDVFPSETVHLTSGQVEMRFGNGAEVTLTGPAVLQVLGEDRALAVRGKLSAQVGPEAVGFSIDTPRAQVVDLGTRFGLEVDDRGQTDVVVFEGEVDIAYGPVDREANDWKRRVMRMGEAVRVDDHGAAKRIVSVESDRFVSLPRGASEATREPLIGRVRDNIRGDDSWDYYEIVHGGMAEDALAYVDRESHQWNGVDASGMPAYLVGGDYVKMFNNDKVSSGYKLKLDIARPCRLYVLFDNRVEAPAWLKKLFRDTGDDIGMDRGPYHKILSGRLEDAYSAGVGPGVSVEDTASIWVRDVREPATVRLGSTETDELILNMYGIVATPIEATVASVTRPDQRPE